jgi:hypothetical protein
MTEHFVKASRIPNISQSVKRLIAEEALRYFEMPREYLAKQLAEKIQSMGEIPPTEETLKRRISDARQHPPSFSPPYWNLGIQLDGTQQGMLPAGAIPKMLEIQRTVKEKLGRTEYFKVPGYVSFWIGQHYMEIEDPLTLFFVAYAYALYVIVGQAADKKATMIDTTELDKLLIERNYEALESLAVGFRKLLQTKKPEDVGNELPEIMSRLKEALTNLPSNKEKKDARSHSSTE